MATVYRCDICKDEKENRSGFLASIEFPLASRYTHGDNASELETKNYDICLDCAKALNEAMESRKKHFEGRQR